MRLVIALAVVALGCGKKPPSAADRCARAAQQGVDAMVKRAHERIASAQLPADVREKMEERTKKLDEMQPRLRALLTNRCVDDKWAVDVIDCYAKVTSMEELRDCRGKLTPDQQAKVQKEELDLFAGVMGPPGFGSAAPVVTPEVARLQIELRRLNAALAAAVKEVADATSEADRAARRAKVDQLQREMQEVSAELTSARAAAGMGSAGSASAGSASAGSASAGSASTGSASTGSGSAAP